MDIDNQQLITWTMMVVVALALDIGAYIFLRQDWKKNGSTLTDRFWAQVFDRASQINKTIQHRIAIALVNYHQASIATDDKPAAADPAPEPLPDATPVEIVPVTVRNIGGVRRVKFSLDMPLDTQVEVRIGATRESGVTVEKREL